MLNRRILQVLSMGLLVLAVGLGLSACGGSDSSSSSESTTASTGESSGESSSEGGAANVSAAEAMIAPYAKEPTPFPVDQPLKKKLPSGSEFGWLQCSTPYCALLSEIYGGATGILGVKLGTVKATESTESIQSGLSSIAAKSPAAVLLAGLNKSSLGTGLTELSENEIPVAVSAIMGDEAEGIDANANSEKAVELAGEVMGNWAIANGAPEAGVLWFETPELDFSKYETEGFQRAMEENCPECEVVIAKMPISAVGSTGPSLAVSELQANPNLKIVLYATFEAATGLPAAMKAAGITDVKVAGSYGTPVQLEDIKSGGLTAVFALDAGTMAFTQVDMAARLATGQPLTKGEEEGIPVLQLLEKKNLEGVDVTKGWSGYPDFAERFAKLWGAAG